VSKIVPNWIVNDNGELGVEVDGAYHFLYKGNSFQYSEGKYENGAPVKVRPVGKREFGECCRSPNWYTAFKERGEQTPSQAVRNMFRMHEDYKDFISLNNWNLLATPLEKDASMLSVWFKSAIDGECVHFGTPLSDVEHWGKPWDHLASLTVTGRVKVVHTSHGSLHVYSENTK
jgi:hypothetical protein